MKARGIVRRIDDLGRVVIPKEIRRTLRPVSYTHLDVYKRQDLWQAVMAWIIWDASFYGS